MQTEKKKGVMGDLIRFRSLLRYNKRTGVVSWRRAPQGWRKSSLQAGKINKANGYRYIRVDGRDYTSARVIHLLVVGAWPRGLMDHKNRDRADDRWCNLRVATHSQNSANRTCVTTGVECKNGKWFTARIKAKKKRYYLGAFGSNAAAYAALQTARKKYHGAFAR